MVMQAVLGRSEVALDEAGVDLAFDAEFLLENLTGVFFPLSVVSVLSVVRRLFLFYLPRRARRKE
jgi:hypothetical protein